MRRYLWLFLLLSLLPFAVIRWISDTQTEKRLQEPQGNTQVTAPQAVKNPPSGVSNAIENTHMQSPPAQGTPPP